MFIAFTDDGQPTLADSDNFRALSVKFDATTTLERRLEAMAALGSVVDEEHVSVGTAQLIAMAGEKGQDAEWRSSFDQMVDYARQHGWVDDAGRVRMHVETA